MKSYRLSQVARKLNIGKDQIIEVLEQKGFEVENNPFSKISEEQLDLLTESLATEIVKEHLNTEHSRERFFVLTQNIVIPLDGFGEYYERAKYAFTKSFLSSTFAFNVYNEPLYDSGAFRKVLQKNLGDDYKNYIVSLPSLNEILEKRSSKKVPFDHTTKTLVDVISPKNTIELTKVNLAGEKGNWEEGKLVTAKGTDCFFNNEKEVEFSEKLLSYQRELRENSESAILNVQRILKRRVCGFKFKRTFYDIKSFILTIIPPKLFYVFADEEDNDRVANSLLSFSMPSFYHAREACLHLKLNIALTQNGQYKIFSRSN